jgi:hypothetical protein
MHSEIWFTVTSFVLLDITYHEHNGSPSSFIGITFNVAPVRYTTFAMVQYCCDALRQKLKLQYQVLI